MRAFELIAFLQKLPDDPLVILSSDPEGNSYHQLSAYVEVGMIFFSETGEQFDPNWSAEEAGFSSPEAWGQVRKTATPCITLYPE